jgi:putative oxidoreductase
MKIVYRLFDFLIAAVFIYAGVLKVLDPVQFAIDIDNYKILPWPIVVAFAFYLPWLEIFCGLSLIARKVYGGGLSILSALVGVFIAASVFAKARGIDITCGCFGHVSKNWSFGTHLAVDFVLFAALLALLAGTKLHHRSSLVPM